ncbi:MAG: FHA domain-containing protein [Pseudomonadales bacterium]
MSKISARFAWLWLELRRRNVLSVGGTYLIGAWGLALGASELLPTFDVPNWAVRGLIVMLALGLPVVLVLAWIFEITPKGVMKDLGQGAVPLPSGVDDPQTETIVAGALEISWRDRLGPHRLRFVRSFMVGRDPDCELRIDDPRVSRQHVRAHFEGGVWRLEDLDSRNGMRVNGAPVAEHVITSPVELVLYEGGSPLLVDQIGLGGATVLAGQDTVIAPVSR